MKKYMFKIFLFLVLIIPLNLFAREINNIKIYQNLFKDYQVFRIVSNSNVSENNNIIFNEKFEININDLEILNEDELLKSICNRKEILGFTYNDFGEKVKIKRSYTYHDRVYGKITSPSSGNVYSYENLKTGAWGQGSYSILGDQVCYQYPYATNGSSFCEQVYKSGNDLYWFYDGEIYEKIVSISEKYNKNMVCK